MAWRIGELEDSVQEQAEELVDRLGSQKQVLSAGILALYDLDDKKRGDYMMKAVGKNIKPEVGDGPPSEDEVYDEIEKLAEQWKITNEKIRAFEAANPQTKTRSRHKTV